MSTSDVTIFLEFTSFTTTSHISEGKAFFLRISRFKRLGKRSHAKRNKPTTIAVVVAAAAARVVFYALIN